VDVSQPTSVVGTGTASSCTEQALAAAVAKGGVVTFDCGGASTIRVTSEIAVPAGTDTTIDGGGVITLDGGGQTRLLHLDNHNYRTNTHVLTLQHLTLANAKATGTPIPQAPAPCSQGYQIDGGGAAVLVNDGVLHVVDVTFSNNAAASPGPDVAGGGVYATGCLEVTIVLSRFAGNSASNGGAVGALNSDLTLVDDVFEDNAATGNGENTVDTSKCSVNGGEIGNGGNAGAVGIDGGSDGTVTVCGCIFSNNTSNGLAGALGRTPDGAQQATNIDRTTFDGNKAGTGGGALYMHNSKLTITASTLSNNSAPGSGAIQADGTTIAFTNDTFYANSATMGLGGALSLFGNDGTIQSCTFAGNHADGGSGLFGAAIAGGTTLTISNSIFANNTSMDCGAPMTCQDGSSTGQADLQWPQQHVVCSNADPACASGGTTFADPMLSSLASNGGPTQTLLPQSGSPAIGAGASCPPTDQRGNTRKANGCTLGAVELP
jgi:predicted outer membrane repeat protein